MKRILFSSLLICTLISSIQTQNSKYNKEYFVTNGNILERYSDINGTKLNPNTSITDIQNKYAEHPVILNGNNTHVRWDFFDQAAVGYEVCTDGLGLNHINGWFLNNMRISLYGNNNNIPYWEYQTFLPPLYYNYVSISKPGDKIAAGTYKNFYIFNRDSANPFFNFDVTTVVQTQRAHNVALSSNGQFLVCVSMPQQGVIDSAIIFGFNSNSNIPVWQLKIFNNQQFDGIITGIRLSGNDSLFILSTFYKFFVIETNSGNVIFQGNVGPNANSNTQEKQGINGDGSVISTTSHDGYLTVYKRSGSSYIQQWRYKDTNSAYQWITVSDVTYDGKYLACGTLDWRWVGYWVYDGQIKLFDIEQGPYPSWEYMHTGDMVTSVSFSKSGNILSACSWGDEADTSSDILIFKSNVNTNIPIFRLNGLGSMLSCNTSENGTVVMVTGKKVHARIFGNGGSLYNISVDTNDNPIGIHITGTDIPTYFKLSQNYPNPFNPTTNIKFQMPKSALAKLVVYDALGREIRIVVNERLSPGTYGAEFDGTNLSSGVYYYKLVVGDGSASLTTGNTNNAEFSETKKMVLIK